MLLKLRLPYVDFSAPFRGIKFCTARLTAMRCAWRERRALAAMDDRMLSDIGLSRAEAEYEANRKPWDI